MITKRRKRKRTDRTIILFVTGEEQTTQKSCRIRWSRSNARRTKYHLSNEPCIDTLEGAREMIEITENRDKKRDKKERQENMDKRKRTAEKGKKENYRQ